MIVVSNAGPIIALAQIEHVHLIETIYNNIYIPSAVYDEIVTKSADRPGSKVIEEAAWIKVVSVENRIAVHILQERLDLGESEAVALALELNADLLLIDESRGRRLSEMQGLNKAGTIGLLITAKNRGLITSVAALLDKLRTRGFRMDHKLYEIACRLAGENG